MVISESTASDWDTNQSETGVRHEDDTNLDGAAADVIEKGYAGYDEGGTSLLTWYPMDEDSGTTMYDLSGNANDGTINGATVGVTGTVGTTAYNFDGTDDYCTFPETTTFAPSNPWTVFLWVNLDTLPSSEDHMLWHPRAEYDYTLFIDEGSSGSQGELAFNSYNSGSDRLFSGYILSTGTWTLCAVRNDGAGNYTIYARAPGDGSATTNSAAIQDPASTSATNVIGAQHSGSVARYYTDGTLDECRMYSRELSTAELDDAFNAML